ncbi:hypothetical protein C8A05DRAFT_38610 [Staphylotrichum tortipilum]|uniref:Uncharacterized protein n=1 Tax=Staphylotrichum tortipilum TaxID=2831512 RepID=A0AAN6RPA7_9PEZI|nr:hypothetical protein C8A05DRAFT_38610 [Staphylotrichum longicolle]
MSAATAAPAPGGHPIPTLAEPSPPEPPAAGTAPRATPEADEKKKKRSLFGFGKKKTDEPAKVPSSKSASATVTTATPAAATITTNATTAKTTTKAPSATMNRTTPAAPIRTDRAPYSPSSPSTRPAAGLASSPRLASPAGSQIFERNVQESAASLLPSSPAIPSHIQTENYIPPVLDASSSAITDDHLNPDTVEIITHPSHQPASVTVAGSIHSPLYSPALSSPEVPSWADELAAFSATRAGVGSATLDTASNYGSFDTTDVRRLSFISFADVVQAEQALFPTAGSRESMHLAGLTSLASIGGPNNTRGRSPSPIRSPVSSASAGLGSSSPASRGGSVKGGLDGSTQWAKPMGSPTSLGGSMQFPTAAVGGAAGQHGTVSGEIAIETMSQALRRTGSGDLGAGAVRSFPTSPV